MTCPIKYQKQAKQQQASKMKAFDSGFIQDLPYVALNLDYQPESDVEHHSSDTDSLVSNGMSFSLMDNSDIASEDSDVRGSDEDKRSGTGITINKWQQTGSHEFTNTIAQFKAADKMLW